MSFALLTDPNPKPYCNVKCNNLTTTGNIDLSQTADVILPSAVSIPSIGGPFLLGTDASGNIISYSTTGSLSVGAPVVATDANALKLSGPIIHAELADGTHPGVLSSTTQTIGGNKTFTGNVIAPNVTGSTSVNTPQVLSSSGMNINANGVITVTTTGEQDLNLGTNGGADMGNIGLFAGDDSGAGPSHVTIQGGANMTGIAGTGDIYIIGGADQSGNNSQAGNIYIRAGLNGSGGPLGTGNLYFDAPGGGGSEPVIAIAQNSSAAFIDYSTQSYYPSQTTNRLMSLSNLGGYYPQQLTTTISSTDPNFTGSVTTPQVTVSGLTNHSLVATNGSHQLVSTSVPFPTRATMFATENLTLNNPLVFAFQNNLNYGTYVLTSGAQNDAFTNSFMLSAGNYTLRVIGITAFNVGIISWYIDNVLVATQDWYSSPNVVNAVLSSAVTVVGNGQHVLKAIIASKNVASSAYYSAITEMTLLPASDTTNLL